MKHATPSLPTWANRPLIVHGLTLFTAGLVAGVTIPFSDLPRTVLAAHVIGITTGLAAIASGFLIGLAGFTQRMQSTLVWAILVSFYAGFVVQWLGGLIGLSRMFIVTAPDAPEGIAWLERVAELITKGITPLTILPFVVILYGLLRPRQPA